MNSLAQDGASLLVITGQLLVIAGALLFSTAGIGVLRLRDAFARSSAIATAAGLGISLILVGVFLLDPSWSAGWKLVVAVLLQLLTSSAGSIALARAAYLTGSQLVLDHPDDDELQSSSESAP